jgi:DNA-binding transcriptional ArsR family regulator
MGDEQLLETETLKLESVLYALSDPVRLYIVRNLAQRGELACFAAVAGLDIAKSTQSHHYRILREAGLIARRKEGVCFISTLRKDEVDAKFPGLLDTILKNCASISAPPRSAC